MMNNKLIAIILVALMLLVLPASAVIPATSVDIRGQVSENSTGTNGNVTVASWDATNFAGFWYDLKDNLKTETLNITSGTINTTSPIGGADRTIDENMLWYNTSKANQTLKVKSNGKSNTEINTAFTVGSNTGVYQIVGWMAQPYIAVNGQANKLAKLVIEQGNATAEKKTLTIGETWDIGEGWTLSAQSIDAKASPRQVWLVLSKDGVKKDDKVISQNASYVYIEKSFAGESDVPLFVTHVDSVFAGATTDMVQLRYTWAIGTSVTEPKVSDKFGKMEVVTADVNNVKLKNKDTTITLTQDGTVDVMGDIKFKVADSSTLRFYPMVTRTTPGIHEIRGLVLTGITGGASYDATNFAALWYDLKDNLRTETINITQSQGLGVRTIAADTLWYNTTKVAKTLKVYSNGKSNTEINSSFSSGQYNIVGWMTQPSVAVNGQANKLAKLVIEQGNATAEKKTLTIGETWDIGDGWTLNAQSIDAKASPRQVWIVLSKDGVKKDDKVIAQGESYVYIEKSFAGESDVPLFVTYVDSVFAGATTDMVQLRYTWAIGTSVTEPKSSDKFGKMEVITADGSNIQLRNKDTSITLTRDATVDVMGEVKFKVADSTAVRYYVVIEFEISGDGETPTTETTTAVDESVEESVEETTGESIEETVEETIEENTEKSVEETVEETTEEPETPGFEAVFAIAGLLAISFLVLRPKK